VSTATLEYFTHGGPVSSSFIDEVYYDVMNRNLYVVYSDHSDHRVYFDVPRDVADDVMKGGVYGSVGSTYNDRVKRAYKSEIFDHNLLTRRNGQPQRIVVPSPGSNVQISATTGTGHSTGQELHFGVSDGKVQEVDFNNYRVEFRIGGVDGEANVQAENDVLALDKFVAIADQLGVPYTLVRMVRTF
jgi:hypothetical protein